jgi:hypothetical protein
MSDDENETRVTVSVKNMKEDRFVLMAKATDWAKNIGYDKDDILELRNRLRAMANFAIMLDSVKKEFAEYVRFVR